MDAKLTLSLNKNTIEQAKKYAQSKNISLSKLIESYLNLVTRAPQEEQAISPLVKSLSGVLHLSPDIDNRKAYTDHLAEKYK